MNITSDTLNHVYELIKCINLSTQFQHLFSVSKWELDGPQQSAPGKLYALKCDITNEEDIKDAFKWMKDNLGGVDILINNAGADRNNTLSSILHIIFVYMCPDLPPIPQMFKRQFLHCKDVWILNFIIHFNPVQRLRI
jgi:NAD(P)-dependent dehydrogenase (short-subunit alcohol dehydrogenase family)